MRDDGVRPFTRVVGAAVLPFLAAAVVLLYILPTRTEQLFAWTILPPLTAMFLGAAYIGGIWFFVRVVAGRRWHRVKFGFPAVVVFAGLLAIATFVHWDRFHFGHISFYTWVTLYVVTPFLVAAAALVNWPADPGGFEERDYDVPFAPRAALALIGALALVCGLLMFVFPAALVDSWAWQLTPLTARVVGAILTLPGAVNLWLLVDSRWSAFRWIFQAELASLTFIVIAVVVARDDLAWSRPAAPVFVAGILISLAAFAAFYAYCERRSARVEASARRRAATKE